MSNSIPNPPDTSSPIIANGGTEISADAPEELGLLRGLVGNWNNPNPTQGTQLGFNVMPLPQSNTPATDNVILKNFPYYEEMTFSAIPGDAANRGGTIQQNCWVVFYEQRVYFGGGPQENTLVHAENGDWLHLINVQQGTGPLDSGSGSTDVPQPEYPIVKQVSVPHGNSILATGKAWKNTGTNVQPNIPNIDTTPTVQSGELSAGLKQLYTFPDTPEGQLMKNPNGILWKGLENRGDITEIITYQVSTQNPGGAMSNILFEHRKANVSAFHTTFWLNTFADGSTLLQYSQTMEMEFPDNPGVTFYHVDAASMNAVS